nr:hypothetical protein [Tanacetum cinerariifolium]
MSYLTEHEEIDGGYVALGGNPKGGKITGKATKDETSGILKSFIIGIKNLVDHKIKVIRCDNGIEFKIREINQFCEMKGILRQFSVAITPQQNKVAERTYMTLIEAAKTMLADSKLPTTFWAEAVKTACYMQNRVLVVKPYNKTPYELFHGRTPTLSFMRPFGCPDTIFNTKDHLSKFNGKVDEEENLPIRFSGSTPNVVGSGPDWLFDIDALTRTMNYKPIVVDPNSSNDDGSKPLSNDRKKVDEDPRKENECNDQEKEDNVNNTNNVNTVSSTVNVAGTNEDNELPFDPNMPALEDVSIFNFLSDDEDDGIVDDMNNLGTTIQVSHIPTTRIHKDYPLDQVIEDLQSTIQTRKMLKNLEERGKIKEEVYVCQPPGFEDPNFPYRVYKVEKALYRLHQAPRAWYETLSTHLLDNGFQTGKIDKTLFIKGNKSDILLVQVYVDDIIFGSTKKELWLQVKQKKDGIFISHDKHVAKILKKFRFTEVKTASTPMETQKPLLKKEDGEEVDVHMHRYHVNPKVSHLYDVKRIFRLGLWYPKDSFFDLVAYNNSDYAGASLDRKSTTGGCKFLKYRLISWQCKKQIVVANSITDAEYVAASMQTPGSGISILLAMGTPSTGSGNLYCQWELSSGSTMPIDPHHTPTILQPSSSQPQKTQKPRKPKRKDTQFGEAATNASSLEAEQDSGNITKTQSKITPNEPSSQGTNSGGGPRCQETIRDTIAQTRFERVSKHFNPSLLVRGREEVFVEEKNDNVVEEVVNDAHNNNNNVFKTITRQGAFRRVNTFEDFRTELVKGKEKRVGEELIQEIPKKQKVDDDKEKVELKQLMETILDEEEVEIDVIPLVVKSPRIVNWKIHKEGKKAIIR